MKKQLDDLAQNFHKIEWIRFKVEYFSLYLLIVFVVSIVAYLITGCACDQAILFLPALVSFMPASLLLVLILVLYNFSVDWILLSTIFILYTAQVVYHPVQWRTNDFRAILYCTFKNVFHKLFGSLRIKFISANMISILAVIIAASGSLVAYVLNLPKIFVMTLSIACVLDFLDGITARYQGIISKKVDTLCDLLVEFSTVTFIFLYTDSFCIKAFLMTALIWKSFGFFDIELFKTGISIRSYGLLFFVLPIFSYPVTAALFLFSSSIFNLFFKKTIPSYTDWFLKRINDQDSLLRRIA